VADRDQITASLSSFTTRAMSNGGSVTEPGSAGNVGDAKLGPNFSLMPGSPAIDSGDPTLTGLDLIGRPRSRDGDSDGVAAPDMGRLRGGAAGCRRRQFDEKAGAQSVKFRARKRPGRYRARIRATDHKGARSSQRRLRFRVLSS
jgi:hypothetical protein